MAAAATTAAGSGAPAAVSRKHVELSLELKRKLIQEHEHGVPFTLLGKKYHIATSTAANIWRKKDFFLRSRMSGSRKRCNDRSKYKIVNQVTALFVKSMLERNHKIDGEVIKRFARTAAAQCNFKDFHGSNGWLDSFKKRENVCWVRRRGERAAAMAAAAGFGEHGGAFSSSFRQSRSESPNIGAAAVAAAVAATSAEQNHSHHHHHHHHHHHLHHKQEAEQSARCASPQSPQLTWSNSNSSLSQQVAEGVGECEPLGCCNRCNVTAAAAALAALNSSDSNHERDHEIEDWFSGIPFLCQFFEEYQNMQQAEQQAGPAPAKPGAGQAPPGPKGAPAGPVSSNNSSASLASLASSNCSAQAISGCSGGQAGSGSGCQRDHFGAGGLGLEPAGSAAGLCSSSSVLCDEHDRQQVVPSMMELGRGEEPGQSMEAMMKLEPGEQQPSGAHSQPACCQSLDCARDQSCAGEQPGSGAPAECNATIVTSGYNSDDQDFYLPSAGYLTGQDAHSDELVYQSEVGDNNGYCSDHYDRVSGCDELQLHDYQSELLASGNPSNGTAATGHASVISFIDQYEYKNISTIRHYPLPMVSSASNSTNSSPPSNGQQQFCQNSSDSFAICSGGQIQQQQQLHPAACRIKSNQSPPSFLASISSSSSALVPSVEPNCTDQNNGSGASSGRQQLSGNNSEQIYQQQQQQQQTSTTEEKNLAQASTIPNNANQFTALMQDYEQSIEHADDEEHHMLHNALMRSPEKLKLIDSIITLLNYASNYNQKMLSPLLEIKRCIERDLEVVLTDTSNQIATSDNLQQ